MNFFAIRYSLLKSSHGQAFHKESMRPQDLFISSLLKAEQTKYYKRLYTCRFLDKGHSDSYLSGYLLKSTDTPFIKLKEKMFSEEDIQNWEKLFFIIDTKRQLIVFEFNYDIASPENIKNVLFKITNTPAKKIGYEVKLDFLIDKRAFWDIINNSSGLHRIAFDLNSSIISGDTKGANEWIKHMKEKYNTTRISFDLRNENAGLEFENEELELFRDYADSGGGCWTLVVPENGRKKKYQSSNHIRFEELEIETDDPAFVAQRLGYLINQLIPVINKFDDDVTIFEA